MDNIPKVKLGIAAVSRDCFPMSLSENRRKLAAKAYREQYGRSTNVIRALRMKYI